MTAFKSSKYTIGLRWNTQEVPQKRDRGPSNGAGPASGRLELVERDSSPVPAVVINALLVQVGNTLRAATRVYIPTA